MEDSNNGLTPTKSLVDLIQKNFFKEGYITGPVFFPGLNVILDIPNFRFFRNDKIVTDIRSHTFSLTHKFIVDGADYRRAVGMCLTRDYMFDVKSTNIYILSAEKCTDYNNMLRYGHESMHAVRRLDQYDQLVQKLAIEGIMLPPFDEYADEEIFAKLGSIIADYRFKSRIYPNNNLIKPVCNFMLKHPYAWEDYDHTDQNGWV